MVVAFLLISIHKWWNFSVFLDSIIPRKVGPEAKSGPPWSPLGGMGRHISSTLIWMLSWQQLLGVECVSSHHPIICNISGHVLCCVREFM